MYANPNTISTSNIKEIMEMGFSEEDAKLALSKNNFELESAVNFLLSR